MSSSFASARDGRPGRCTLTGSQCRLTSSVPFFRSPFFANNLDQDLGGIDRSATTLDGNGVSNDFDVDKIKENQALGQAAGYVGMRAAGDLADYMADHASTDQDQKSWGEGGTYRVLLHGLVGAATAELGGGNATQGALGAAASEAASGAMANYLADHHIDPNSAEGRTLMELASAAVGGAVGGGAGATTALDGEKYNRQLHAELVNHISDDLAKRYAADHGISEEAARDILLRAVMGTSDDFDSRYLSQMDDAETRQSALQFLWEKGTEEVKCHRALLPPATVARAAARSLGLNVV